MYESISTLKSKVNFEKEIISIRPKLVMLARKFFHNHEDAEDAVQDACISAFRNIHQFRGDSKFSTWMYRIVINASNMHKRGTKYTFVQLPMTMQSMLLSPDKLVHD